jgi:hypothetical protein
MQAHPQCPIMREASGKHLWSGFVVYRSGLGCLEGYGYCQYMVEAQIGWYACDEEAETLARLSSPQSGLVGIGYHLHHD